MDVSGALAAQGLDTSDLEANRAGRISERQLARQFDVRRRGRLGVWVMAVCAVVGCSGFGAFRFVQHGDAGLFVFMSILGLVMAVFPLGIYYAFRFIDPAKIAGTTVTRIDNAEVGVFLPAPYRGVYSISLNGHRYSGFANSLTRVQLGARVNAYIIPEHRIVVALEPVS
ncbi:MAG TPA: hypothetical protein VI306_13845 [Pyrinomonadaceae bacterium]